MFVETFEMKHSQADLLQELEVLVKRQVEQVKAYRALSSEQLNWKKNPASWSLLECIEHINLYGDYYLPEIEKQILSAEPDNSIREFNSGWLGGYFAKMMLPKNEKIVNVMKTFKDKNPVNSGVSITVIDRFMKQQEQMIQLLRKANGVDLNKVRTGISISSFIRIKLGDTFRVVIYHQDRHALQLRNIHSQLN